LPIGQSGLCCHSISGMRCLSDAVKAPGMTMSLYQSSTPNTDP
jgi:hypothetical protein